MSTFTCFTHEKHFLSVKITFSKIQHLQLNIGGQTLTYIPERWGSALPLPLEHNTLISIARSRCLVVRGLQFSPKSSDFNHRFETTFQFRKIFYNNDVNSKHQSWRKWNIFRIVQETIDYLGYIKNKLIINPLVATVNPTGD